MNLSDIVQSAQGGQAVDNLSARFGLSPQQTQTAINALLPAFEIGLQNMTQSGGLGTLLQHLGSATHQQSYTNAGAAASPASTTQGGSILGDVFGGQGASTEVARQASAESGVSTSVIQAMLPVLASIIMGGLFHQGQSGGLGGILSQVIGAALGQQSGGGSIFGQGASAPRPTPRTVPSDDQTGGLGGVLGGLLGGLLGGGETTEDAAPRDTARPASPPASSSEAVLDELSRAFEAGTPTSPGHAEALAGILGPGRRE